MVRDFLTGLVARFAAGFADLTEASAFLAAVCFAAVEPFEGIAIGPCFDAGRNLLDNQTLRFAIFFTFLN